ncbi:MAG: Gfo/Idh/MocA family oxidoreductase, partial [Phycisphaerae bacterium]|nr:Gfo/Idh/MocA family oxidoreductase [Phycisphaerae bacterium]
MSNKIKWGVIGSGGIARRRTIPEGISKARNGELSVVLDITTQGNTEVAEEFDAEEAGSIEALLDADIDAVYIATPPYYHAGQVHS